MQPTRQNRVSPGDEGGRGIGKEKGREGRVERGGKGRE